MAPQSLILVLAFLSMSYALENLKLKFQWKQVDFDYPTEAARQEAINSGQFIPINNLPLGLEIYGDRLFITVPRWKTGVPASLNYINIKDTSESPKLRPYPNWAAHKLPDTEDGDPPEIVSPFRVRADQCDRLWVLDTGRVDIVGTPHDYTNGQVVIYDLRTDALLRRYLIPKEQVGQGSFLANLAVEDEDCDKTFAYFGDLGDPGVVVYSFEKNTSWRLKHHFFNYNPLFVEFNVAGSTFTWPDGIFGMGLTAPEADGFSTLYFHPMAGTHEFSISTKHLRSTTLAESDFNKFKIVGTRGTNGQSSVSFLDKKSKILFYALVTHNAIACWNTSNPTYVMENQGRIHESAINMLFPNDIKVDRNDNIWVLSDRLPIFLYQTVNVSDFNYRIFMTPVSEAIKNTVCDSDSAPLSPPGPQILSAEGPTTQNPPGQILGVQDYSEIFTNFKPPGKVPAMVQPSRPGFANTGKPVEAFAVAEIPNMLNNKFKPSPQQPQFAGAPDLAFMFKPFQGPDTFNPYPPPGQVAVQATAKEENGKKGLEFMINVPVNLYITVENP